MFINFSNHPSSRWSKEQIDAAKEYGEVKDIAFPNVDPLASTESIHTLAKQQSNIILSYNPDAVLVQGEMTLSFNIVYLLKNKGIKVLSACTARDAIEVIDENGNTIKKSIFSFKQFREY